MPTYGRSFENTLGPGHPFRGVGAGSFNPGVWDVKDLPFAGATVYVDEEAGASYSYDREKEAMVSYDTVEMARRKAEWIKAEGLGGGMWWESSGDGRGERSLVSAVVDVLGDRSGKGLDRRGNCLDFSNSKFENLRRGFPGE
jgi:chitinase